MKKFTFLSLLLFVLLAACQTTPDQTPAQPTAAPITVTAAPTPTLAAGATAVPTTAATAVSTTAASNPQFNDLALLPNRASLSAGWPQPYNPLTTEELYAVWDYSGMTAADQLERLWYFNGALWLERSEAWDMNKYGANGRMQDIFVFDYEPSLAPGHYRVVLKVNGVELASAEHTIPANTVGPIVEPDSGFTAAVQDHKTLVLRRVDGTTAAWESFGDIVDLAWLPGGQHIVYSEQIVVNAELPGTLGLRHNLWLQNVITGQKNQLRHHRRRTCTRRLFHQTAVTWPSTLARCTAMPALWMPTCTSWRSPPAVNAPTSLRWPILAAYRRLMGQYLNPTCLAPATGHLIPSPANGATVRRWPRAWFGTAHHRMTPGCMRWI